MSNTATIGSVISGTTNARDLIPAFMKEINALGGSMPSFADSPINDLMNTDSWLEAKADAAEAYLESEEAYWDLEELFDALDEMSPEFAFFGAHPDDGADYGFWPVEVEYEEDFSFFAVDG